MTFTVDARTDAGTLTYQWQRNNANLSGANTNTLTINSVQESNKGEYRCIVSNAPKSTTTSNAAQLTLCECFYIVCLIQLFWGLPMQKFNHKHSHVHLFQCACEYVCMHACLCMFMHVPPSPKNTPMVNELRWFLKGERWA